MQVENFLLIIGAMKCGTSSLYKYLIQHPEVAECHKKEPGFFSNRNYQARDLESYSQLWNFIPGQHSVALEASTEYTKFPYFSGVAERIHDLNANFKFIYIVRDPIERIESHYTHGQSQNWKFSQKPLEEEIDSRLINISRYAMQLDEYLKYFSREQILVINFSNFKNSPDDCLKEICKFSDINQDFEFSPIGQSNSATSKVIDGPEWKLLKPLTKPLPHKKRQAIRQKLGKPISGRFRLSEQAKESAILQLKDDLFRLQSEYEVDISNWGLNL
jgi:hypothetical protein